MTPLLWSIISRAAIVTGPKMSPTEIVKELRKKDNVLFSKLAPQTLGAWIDRSGDAPRWSDQTMRRVEQGNRPGGLTTRVGVLVGIQFVRYLLDVCSFFDRSLIPPSPKHF